MDNKFYVSYEAARLLKEKGYDGECTNYYDEMGELLFPYHHQECHVLYPVITKAEAIDWLESKGMMVEISIDIDECAWIFNIVNKEKFITIGHPKDGEFFTDRLEAEEAAIIKACELL